MSEKIYAFLLRLQSPQFREAYGDEALQLFRDRARDEQGFFPTLRLWLDLLADLAISVPRGYAQARPDLGLLLFPVLEMEPVARGAFLFGGILSLIAFAALPGVITEFGNHRPFRWSAQAAPQRTTESTKLDAAVRQRVIRAAVANLKEHYIDPAVAEKMADALLKHEQNGDYDAVPDANAFAGLLTKQLRDVSHDMHLDVVHTQRPLPDGPPAPTREGTARYRKAMEEANCTFEKVEILPPNIGYLKLNSFPDTSVCQSTAIAAMASLNQADTVIFDLRDNGGGFPNMVAFLAAYLFDHPEYLYNPRENTTRQSWTQSPVSGNKLADKPVYLLTSTRTASGAEQFSYDLKMLKRVTLVGETTRGSAHAAVFHRLDEHFGMGITESRPINPFSDRDWEGTGVEPDVKVKAGDALDTAKKLAESKSPK